MALNALQISEIQPWLVAAAALVVLTVLLVLLFRSLPAEPSDPAGLPRSPEGWEPLRSEGNDELVRAVRRSGEPQARYYQGELPSGQTVALGHTPRHPWVDVFVRRRLRDDPEGIHTGPYEVYSYHLREERWSYGAVPPSRKELESLVQEGFAGYLADVRRR